MSLEPSSEQSISNESQSLPTHDLADAIADLKTGRKTDAERDRVDEELKRFEQAAHSFIDTALGEEYFDGDDPTVEEIALIMDQLEDNLEELSTSIEQESSNESPLRRGMEKIRHRPVLVKLGRQAVFAASSMPVRLLSAGGATLVSLMSLGPLHFLTAGLGGYLVGHVLKPAYDDATKKSQKAIGSGLANRYFDKHDEDSAKIIQKENEEREKNGLPVTVLGQIHRLRELNSGEDSKPLITELSLEYVKLTRPEGPARREDFIKQFTTVFMKHVVLVCDIPEKLWKRTKKGTEEVAKTVIEGSAHLPPGTLSA